MTITNDMKQRLWLVGNDLVKLMSRRAPVDTGVLKNSIRHEVDEEGNINIYMTDYARHVEYGTKPHVIRIKNKKALSDGKTIFGTKVNHPGTRAQPFIRPSLHQLSKIVKHRLDDAEVLVKVST